MTELRMPKNSTARSNDESAIGNVVVCWGELLWDVIGDLEIPGGAPLNVAFYLNRLGLRAYPASAVGNDRRGYAMLEFLRRHGISGDFVQIVPELPTGLAHVMTDPNGISAFQIDDVSAWDRIPVSPKLAGIATGAVAVVFGSLAQRGHANIESLESILASTQALKIMDVNLRPPFNNSTKVLRLARQADILKVSEDELRGLLASWADDAAFDCETRIAAMRLARLADVPVVAVTSGSKGAAILDNDIWHVEEARLVPVVDTVGAGDAFLAGLLAGHLRGLPWPDALARACRLAETSLGYRGALPCPI